MEYLNVDGRIKSKLKINLFLDAGPDILTKINLCFMETSCLHLHEGGGRRFLKKSGNFP
jgi:hypothetical protein